MNQPCQMRRNYVAGLPQHRNLSRNRVMFFHPRRVAEVRMLTQPISFQFLRDGSELGIKD